MRLNVHFIVAKRTRHSGLKRAALRLACFSPADWKSTELFLVDGEEAESLISRVVVDTDLPALVDEAADLFDEVEKNMSAVCCLAWILNMVGGGGGGLNECR